MTADLIIHCPFCTTTSPYGALECSGCDATVTYGMTQKDRSAWFIRWAFTMVFFGAHLIHDIMGVSHMGLTIAGAFAFAYGAAKLITLGLIRLHTDDVTFTCRRPANLQIA